MTIELIPVLEIEYNDQEVPTPDKNPYWEYPELWDKYNAECCKNAGFTDNIKPYLSGSCFYQLTEVTDDNLRKLVFDHTREMRAENYQRPQDTCTFWGGYVLKVDGQDRYYPQCCGELSDIIFWESISNGKSSYHNEHPTPQIKFENNKIIFDFSADEFDEVFQPTPKDNFLYIDRIELKRAVERTKTELKNFEKRLDKINQDEKLCIYNIGGLLIWGD